MHNHVREHLEDLLRDAPDRRVSPQPQAHLEGCPACRDEIRRMQEQARLLRVLRAPGDSEPGAGFYARVTERIEARRGASLWSSFLDAAFGRRFVFATLAVILLLSGYVVATEPQFSLTAASPEVIMAVEPHPYEVGADQNPEQDRETVLVSLASYQE